MVRCEIPMSDPLAKRLRASREAMERIARQDRTNAAGLQAVRNLLLD